MRFIAVSSEVQVSALGCLCIVQNIHSVVATWIGVNSSPAFSESERSKESQHSSTFGIGSAFSPSSPSTGPSTAGGAASPSPSPSSPSPLCGAGASRGNVANACMMLTRSSLANAFSLACFSIATSSSRHASRSGFFKPCSVSLAYAQTHTATLLADIRDAVSSIAISKTVHVPFVGIFLIVPSDHKHWPISSGDMFSATSRQSASSALHLSSSGVLHSVPYAQKRFATAAGATIAGTGAGRLCDRFCFESRK
mmetsp:Transcript_15004/g.49421  ORF Transcript_15004/g.49421 Transcript_15004/m.49421 type:complete len:253 (-) Transcript_15004:5-763(-)